MKLSLYIARRYLFAKKSRNAINIISGISVAGVTVGSMVLIIVLSVFNGLEDMVDSLFSTFDPDLEITAARGKVFTPESKTIEALEQTPGIAHYSMVLEENSLLKYGDKQTIATVKGVDDNYSSVTGLDDSMYEGEFKLKAENGRMHAVVGHGVANRLSVGLNFLTPLVIYVPKRDGSISDPSNAFKRRFIFPSGIFSVEQEFDSQYIFVPIELLRDLLMYKDEVSAIEIKYNEGISDYDIQERVENIFGQDFIVKNKYQQQEIYYKVMKSERLAIFFILSFILIIASFNVIGSLTMLIIEKEKDIRILRNMGANNRLIKNIFLLEGWMISLIGAVMGLALGFLVCWLQLTVGIVKLQGETLIMDAYPVAMKISDFAVVLVTVVLIGFGAAWYPVNYMSKKFLKNEPESN